MQPAPPLKVSKQVTNVHSATKHSHAQHQKQTSEAAKNSSAPHARGGSRKRGYRKKRRKQRGGEGQTVPTLSSTSGPPKSSPSPQGNINNSHKTNAAIVSKAANDSKVQAPKCKASQSGGGSAVKVGQFMESLHNMDNKIGGSKKRHRKRRGARRRSRRRRTRRRRRRGTRRRSRRRRRKSSRKLRRRHKRRTRRTRRKNRR